MFAFVASAGLGPYLFGGLIVGSVFMFFGLKELRKYDPVFIYAYFANFALFLCGILSLVGWIFTSFTPFDFSVFNTVTNILKIGVSVFFEITMLYGIADLSRRVEYPDTRTKAYRNMIFVGTFYVFQIALLIAAMLGFSSTILMTLLMLVQVIYAVFNAMLLFKCYAMICPASDEEMPQKKSRFAFINKFREIRDAKDEKAAREMKEYYEEKLKKKNAKKNAKNNSKSNSKSKKKK